MRRVIFIDTETGGVDPYYHSLLSIGCIGSIWDNGSLVEVDSFYREIKHSEYVVTSQALSINKLYPEHINKSEYSDIKSHVIKDFRDWVKHQTFSYREKPVPAGHNLLQFDKPFIQREMNIDRAQWGKMFHYIPIDTMIIADFLAKSNIIDSPSLGTGCGLTSLAGFFNIDMGNRDSRHHALDDARIAMQIYNKMLRIGCDLFL